MNIIETQHLNFGYRRQNVLSNVSLQVPKHSIYGYLGANGSGKTTTIRILLGLLGNCENVTVCEQKMCAEKNRIVAYQQIGSLVNPFFMYRHLTVKEHFDCLNIFYKKTEEHATQIIEKIGLAEQLNKKARHLSSGMQQRLAIGLAIFNEPKLLILDEPINGLDPVGIYEMRELFLALNRQGTTIFLSSHILAEVEKICTHIGVLHEGKLLYQGALNEFVSENQSNSLENIYMNLIQKNNE
jgi:ABC-2 type transport system ATP-binding protein